MQDLQEQVSLPSSARGDWSQRIGATWHSILKSSTLLLSYFNLMFSNKNYGFNWLSHTVWWNALAIQTCFLCYSSSYISLLWASWYESVLEHSVNSWCPDEITELRPACWTAVLTPVKFGTTDLTRTPSHHLPLSFITAPILRSQSQNWPLCCLSFPSFLRPTFFF